MRNLVSENVVITANQLNPSLFTQLWLVQHGIVGEEDFAPDCVFSQFVTQISTSKFQLLIVPQQLQFTPTERSRHDADLIKGKVGTIIEKIPHTPYTAIGTNFHWLIAPEPPEGYVEFMRSLFAKPGVPIYDEFSENNARFGTYLSKDVFGVRLKINVTPVKSIDKEEPRKMVESLQLAFNYQLDIVEGPSKVDRMIEFLEKWGQMESYSEKLVSVFMGCSDYI